MSMTPKIADPTLKDIYDKWVRGKQPQNSDGKPNVVKQRCLKIAGREIACVQDKGTFRLTPTVLIIGGLLVVLLMRR